MRTNGRLLIVAAGLAGALAGLIGLALGSRALGMLGIFAAGVATSAVMVRGGTRAAPARVASAGSPAPSRPAAVAASPEPGDVLEALIDHVAMAEPVAAAHLWLTDPATRTLRLVCARGRRRPAEEPVVIGSGILGRAASTGVAVLEVLARETSAGASRAVWRFAVPVSTGEVDGVAAVDVLGDAPDVSSLTGTVASRRGELAAALVLHVSRAEAIQARGLIDTTAVLFGTLDAERVLGITLDRAVEITGADTGSVMLLGDDGRLVIRAAHGLPEDVVASTSVGEGEGVAGWVLATKQSAIVEDLEDRGVRSRRHGVRSALAVPMLAGDRILGVLNVGSRRFQGRFTRTQLTTLETLGRVAATALENALAASTSRELHLDTLRALALALETKDPYSRGATERVLELALQLGEAMGLNAAELAALRVAATLHDVGMSAAGDVRSVGHRPLSTVEWGMLKMHPVIAAEVLEQAPSLKAAVPIVYHHHEHYDGSGYVLGMAGDAIPLGARVLAVADAYVSMTSPRPYRAALTHEEALAEIVDKAGTQFDPEVVSALQGLLGRGIASRRT